MENDFIPKRKKKSKHKKQSNCKKSKRSCKASSSEESSDEMEWVEASSLTTTVQTKETIKSNSSNIPKVQRDEWMSDETFVPTLSKAELLQREGEKKKSKRHLQGASPIKLGQHERELNPHWKNDGTGVPNENLSQETSDLKLPSCSVGDGGYNWLRKAYQRVKEKAQDEGRSMEEVAVERWGSLEKLTSMLAEAEKRMKINTGHSPENHSRKQYKQKYVEQSKRHYHTSREQEAGYFCSSSEKEKTNSSRKEMNFVQDKNAPFSQPSYDKSIFNKPKDGDDNLYPYERKGVTHCKREYNSSNYEDTSFSKLSRDKSMCKELRNIETLETSLPFRSSYNASWKKKVHASSDTSEKVTKDCMSYTSVQSVNEHNAMSSSHNLSTHSLSISMNISNDDKEKTLKFEPEEPKTSILTDNEMNNLAAKVIKAEILGNDSLASKLKEKLDAARKARETLPLSLNAHNEKQTKEKVILTKMDRHGVSRPLHTSGHHKETSEGKKWKTKETGKDQLSKKMSYFGEESNHSLKQMFEREKLITADDHIEMLIDASISCKDAGEKDYEIGDVSAKVLKKMGQKKQDERDYNKAIQEHKRMNTAMEKCEFCFDKVKKHLIVTVSPQAYLCVPPCQSLTENHCLIVPKEHFSSSLFLDEDAQSEIQVFKKALINMFKKKNQCVVFMEISMNLRSCPHTVIECYPLPVDIGELAPLYFKKAILESESDWAHNKQLIDLFKKDFRHSVPKGLPFFAVEFSTGGGYAHIIEDERFPKYFGKEVLGGMLELDYNICARYKKEEFKDQAKKTLKFIKQWEEYKSSCK